MAKRFQKVAAVALLLLLVLPGASLAQLLQAPDPVAATPVPERLAERALGAALQSTGGTPLGPYLRGLPHTGADSPSDLEAMQPTLESILRYYAQDRGLTLTPPRTPDVRAPDALTTALTALAALKGQVLTPDETARAADLPPELQQALARIVLGYVQAVQQYTEALAPLTRDDAVAMLQGQAPLHPPDGGKIASAALLVDRAVRESTPALRKWALLMAIEERARHPTLGDATPDALLRAGAVTQDLRNMVDLASVLHGWQPVAARFQATSQTPSQAMGALYAALGLPVFLDDQYSFALLDQEPAGVQAIVLTMADALTQAAQALRQADALVSDTDVARASELAAGLDLRALAGQDPERLDTAQLSWVVDTLEKADEALQLRLDGTAKLADALAQVKQLAPLALAPRGVQTESTQEPGSTLRLPTVAIPNGCTIGADPATQRMYVDCGHAAVGVPVGNTSLPVNFKFIVETTRIRGVDVPVDVIIYDDRNDDGAPGENELLLRSPSLADPANDIVFHDPAGFILVGGQGSSRYDTRYGHVNVSIRPENGTIVLERSYVTDGGPVGAQLQGGVYGLTDSALGAFAGGHESPTNFTLYNWQDNGLVNFTLNPENHTLLIVDLGGDDTYTARPGGAEHGLWLYNASVNPQFAPFFLQFFCFDAPPVAFVTISAGGCSSFAASDRPENGVAVTGLRNADPTLDDGVYLNATNLSLPVRLSVAFDASGNDVYAPPLNFSLGASRLGIGVLWDAETCLQGSATSAVCPHPSAGNDVYRAQNFSLGTATNDGIGLFLDEAGNDVHTAWNWSIGAGFARGVGLAVDLAGDDQWYGQNYTMGSGGYERIENHLTSAGIGTPNNQITANLTSTPGIGVLIDRRGDDAYAQFNVSSNQGKGWPAFGALLDLAGTDVGLQTNVTVQAGSLGTYGVGVQSLTVLAQPSRHFWDAVAGGQGGGIVLDAELPDTAALQGKATAAPNDGLGMDAVEVQGNTTFVGCPYEVAALLGSTDPLGVSQKDKKQRCDAGVPYPQEQPEYVALSHQAVLLRVPGVFGLGGVANNNGREAKASEEHMLHIDLAGDDAYRGPFAGAVVPDLSKLDTEGAPAVTDPSPPQRPTPQRAPNMAPLFQGGEVAPFMVAIDVQGSDVWDGRTGMLNGSAHNLSQPTLGGAFLGVGMLFDLGQAAAGGASNRRHPDAGLPPACQRPVNDVYIGFNHTMGYGALYGVGTLVDADGDDCYAVLDQDAAPGARDAKGNEQDAFALGAARLGGVGVLLDQRGNDTYIAGNFSMGAGILEPTNNALPRRTGVGTKVEWHNDNGGCPTAGDGTTNSAQVNTVVQLTCSPQLALGALYDARGYDRYTAGDRSQGWGRHVPSTQVSGNRVDPKVLAGLFVDDGFENDTYAYGGNLSTLNATDPLAAQQLQLRRDDSFWCATPVHGPLNTALNVSLPALPLLTAGPVGVQFDADRALLRQGFDAARAQLAAAGYAAQVAPGAPALPFDPQQVVDDAERQAMEQLDLLQGALEDHLSQAQALADGASADAQALADQALAQAQAQLDGQVAASRETLQAVRDAVVDGPNEDAQCLKVEPTSSNGLITVDTGNLGRGFDNLDFYANFLLASSKFGEEYVAASKVLRAPAVVFTPGHACAEPDTEGHPENENATDCARLNLTVDVLPHVIYGPASFGINAARLVGAMCAKQAPTAEPSCALAARTLEGPFTSLALGAAGGSVPLLTNSGMRRVEFYARPAGTHGEADVLLGHDDRREGTFCNSRFDNALCDRVGHAASGDLHVLRWNTASLRNGTLHPVLRTPDGAYDVVVKAYYQLDDERSVLTGAPAGQDAHVVATDDQRFVLNRLGDEYGYYPGQGTLPVVVDNPPVVYALTYRDVSRAPGPSRCVKPGDDVNLTGANRCLALHIAASPPLDLVTTDVAGDAHDVSDPAYHVRSRILRADARATLMAATPDDGLACPVDRDSEQASDDGRFLDTACRLLATPDGPVLDIVTGFTDSGISRLTAGKYQLLVDVAEPKGTVEEPMDGSDGSLRCFAAHGSPLLERIPAPQYDRVANATTPFACSSDLAVDAVLPSTLASFSPAHTGADGAHYVNLSVAYPGGVGVHVGNATEVETDTSGPGFVSVSRDATLPLKFNVTNAAQKASPVVAYRVRSVQSDVLHPGKPRVNETCFAVQGLDVVTALPGLLGSEPVPCLPITQPEGNLSAPWCGSLPTAAICVNSDAHDLLRTDVQVMGIDLAGNAEPLARTGALMVAEDSGVLDVQPPGQSKAPSKALGGPVLCQQVSTGKPADPAVPRVRTANRTFPLAWDPSLAGCNSGAVETDNGVVEATRIAYNISSAALSLAPDNMGRAFTPGPEDQLRRVANVSIDALGLQDTFLNNRTMYAMAQGVDMAGNAQLAHLCVCAHVAYDDRAPDVALLNLTVDHAQADLRWFAADAEAGGRVARSYLNWGPVGRDGADNLTLVANATQVGTTAILHLGDLAQDTLYSAQVVSADDVGNTRALPVLRFRTDPVANITISSPQPGDLLHGNVDLRFNVSDVREDPLLTYDVSIVEQLPDGGVLVLEVENFTRTECLPPGDACPTPADVVPVSRSIVTDRFPDTTQAFLRIAVNSSLDPGQPHVVSVGPFTIDNTPPLTKLNIGALGGPVWFRSAATLDLAPVDNTTRVVSTEYSFDNFTFVPFNASSPPQLGTEGQVPFFFRSTDVVGNVEPLRTVFINIDRQKPVGSVSIDLGAAATNDPNVTLLVRAADALSGVANVTLDLGSGAGAVELDHPERFANGRSIPVELPGGQGERRVRVRVTDLAGNVEELKAVIFVDQLPPVITDVRVDAVEHTAATLSWQTDEPSPSRVDVGLQGASILATRFEVPEPGRAHTLALSGLRPSATYHYRVVATDALGNRAVQDGTLTTLPDVQPPGAPTSLAALDLGNGVTHLTWLPAFDDVGIDHYVVLRGVAGQLDELAETPEVQFYDDTALPGVGYDYAVQAIDLAGQPGPLSAVVHGKATTAPELLGWHVTPDSGAASQVFTYTVVVKDADGDTPASVRVRISGTALEMRPQFTGTADFSRGVTYTLATRLPTTTLEGGFPTYQFEASDGVHSTLAPDAPASGPAVLGFGAVIPGLNAATTFFGLPGFEAVLSLAGLAGAAALLAVLRRRRDA